MQNLTGNTTAFESEPLLAERFEILRVLGQGGASIVYHARDRSRQNLSVALKLLVNDKAFDEHVLERFREEVRICRALNHPNLVKAYDLIEGHGVIAFTMEYIDGEDLSSLIKRGKPPQPVVDTLLEQLLSAVDELHSHGILHRDIKLENIMIRRDGVLKLTDLGLIKSPELGGLTRTGILLGTAQYMPPEYVRQSVYDRRGDIYAIGCVLYELLTGIRRLANKNGAEALEHLIKTNFSISKNTLSGFPKRYIPIIERAMAVELKDRYQNVAEMREELRSIKANDAAGSTGIKLKSNLDAPSAMRRLAANHELNRARHGVRGLTKAVICTASLSAVLVLLAVVGVYRLSHSVPAPEIALAPGEYQVLLATDDKGEKISATLSIPKSASEPLMLKSEFATCKVAKVDPAAGKLECNGQEGKFTVTERGVSDRGGSYWRVSVMLPGWRSPRQAKIESR